MILTGKEICKEVSAGGIVISPFDRGLINPNSYNYRLGPYLKISHHIISDPSRAGDWETIRIPEDGFILEPGRVYLGHTYERIGSSKFVTSLIGRSSVGRLGLYLQISADLGQIGAIHQWTLELVVVQPLWIYPNMPIGQVSFWRIRGKPDMLYSGKYKDTNNPTPSRFLMDFQGKILER